MQRATLLLVTGIALGAAGAFYYDAHRHPTPTTDDFRVTPAPANRQDSPRLQPVARPDVIAALAARPLGTAERAALYDYASRAERRELEALLEEAAALSDQAPRTFALDVLLLRHAELDPGGAVAAAERLQMPVATVTALYHAWFESAPTTALAALGERDDATARMIGADLIAVAGDDELTVNRILATVPRATVDTLTVIALTSVARHSPAEALARAEQIVDAGVRHNALQGVLYAWAERDPLEALRQADGIDDPTLRRGAQANAFWMLLQREPRAALDYLENLAGAARRDALSNGQWQQLASIDPRLVLERTEELPAEIRASVEQVALSTLAQLDPHAAMAQLARMPPGAARQQLVQDIARVYVERDIDGALAWVRSLQPPEPAALTAVITGIAVQDPMRALDLATEIAAPMEQMQALQSVVMATTMEPAMSERLLERVLTMPSNMQRQSLAQMLVSSWAAREPAEAAEWLLANAERAPLEVVTQVASQYARLDAEQAASYTARMPSSARGAWLRGVAGAYAAADPHAALDWVEQFRGSPEYDDAAVTILQFAPQHDPAAAARLLDSIGNVDYQQSAIVTVGANWANRDPAAAANWAANLREPAVRIAAVSVVAQSWAAQDVPATQAWVLSQPAGRARDSALMALVSTAAQFDALDTSLLDAFSTEQGHLAAVHMAALGVAQHDPDHVREFVETHVAAQADRDRILSFIKQVPRLPAPGVGFIASPIGPGFLPTGGPMPAMPAFGTPVLIAEPGGSVRFVTPAALDGNGR